MKRFTKLKILIPTVFILIGLVIFGGWYVLPSHPLDIVVLDKTVPASADTNTITAYRKHYGLFWMLNQLKYNKVKNDKPYDYKKDYYGSVLDKSDTPQIRSMARLETTPHLLYLSDTYGTQSQNDDSDTTYNGLNYEDIAAASTAHVNGTTLIAESDVLTNTKEESIRKELESLFSITYSSWTGRYITDMSDLSDIPEWAQNLHESQYGRKWNYTGAGILLVSEKGELIVLEENDFNHSMLSVSIADEYMKEFGNHSLNYYNWFAIVNTTYNSETIAEYHLDLNESGKEKFSRVSDNLTFPAVVRTKGEKAPAYFFAGEFNDYVANERFPRFMLSNVIYQFFSYDRAGDITHFYWDFYYPLMKTILSQTEHNKTQVIQPKLNTASSFHIQDNCFELMNNSESKPFVIKGFNINAVMAGSQLYEYTRDIAVYRQFINEISAMGGNCIRVYDLLPPEFYRALYEHNLKHPDKLLYFFQTIVPPSTISSTDTLATLVQPELQQNIEFVVDAIHGKGTVPDVGSRSQGTYIQDVSAYLIGYLVQTDSKSQAITKLNNDNNGYVYNGEYLSSSNNAAEGLVAMLCDYIYSYQQKAYGYIAPVGAMGNASLISSAPWEQNNNVSFDIDSLTASDKTEGTFFVSYALNPNDTVLLNSGNTFTSYTDAKGNFAYGGYIRAFKQSQTHYPVLIDRFGLSTNTNAFEKETSINGLSEAKQGEGIVRMLEAINREGYLGGLISDYNDNWSTCSKEFLPYVLPLKDNRLWQNSLDPLQNSGVTAMEPSSDKITSMTIKDTDRLKEMQISANASYINLTIMLDGEINYDKEQFIIGLDTYQRNNGEYRYDPSYFATSLSGMEYVIKFESKNTAAIYVVPNYNRNNSKYSSKEAYTGEFDYICQLTYGSFEYSGTNFYQTGSTIHIRIPWNLLNFTDPAKKMVINDTRTPSKIMSDTFGLQTTSTDGILFSLLIADKFTKDSLYVFPADKQASGYKTFSWDSWNHVDYILRQKQSYKILSRYFNTL